MASLEYYFSDNEMSELVKFALGRGFVFVPDRPYHSRRHDLMDALNDIIAFRERALLSRSWFLVRKDYVRHAPLPMEKLTNASGGPEYRIRQRYLGPTIDLLWSGRSKADNDFTIATGQLSHHARFIDPDTQEEVRASESLRAAYGELAKRIRSRAIRSEQTTGQPGAWIGTEAARAWKSGMALGHAPLSRQPSRVPDQ